MDEFLATALSMPTLAFSLALAVILVYWLSVMIGALDLDFLDPGGFGATEGVGEGAAEGLADGALDGAADGAVDGATHAGHHAEVGMGGLAGLLSALHLRSAPLTVTLSFVTLFGWLGAYFGTRYLATLVPLAGWIAGLLVTALAVIVAVPLTALVTRPLAPLFKQERSLNRRDLVGKEGVIRFSPGESRIGQAELRDAGTALVLKVRVAGKQEVERGDSVLVLGYDEDEDVYDVEPLDAIVPSGRSKRSKRDG